MSDDIPRVFPIDFATSSTYYSVARVWSSTGRRGRWVHVRQVARCDMCAEMRSTDTSPCTFPSLRFPGALTGERIDPLDGTIGNDAYRSPKLPTASTNAPRCARRGTPRVHIGGTGKVDGLSLSRIADIFVRPGTVGSSLTETHSVGTFIRLRPNNSPAGRRLISGLLSSLDNGAHPHKHASRSEPLAR